jgi:acyl-CoA thioesterase-1
LDGYGGLRGISKLFVAGALALMSQAAVAAPVRTILALGDSLTAGYQLAPADGFAPQLEAALRAKGRNVRVYNAGVSGDTTTQGRARLAWVLKGLKAKPDLAIVQLGANDMLRGQPPATAKANLDAIVTTLKAQGIPVVLAGMLASPNLGPGYGREFNAVYPTLAAKHRVPLYPFFMAGVVGGRGLQIGDGIHPSKAGVAVIVRGILPTVTGALDRLPTVTAALDRRPTVTAALDRNP